jgi:hypothetical protein
VNEVWNEQEQKILKSYQDGTDLGYMVEKLNIPYKVIEKFLIEYKDKNRLPKSFTEEFKMVIAERDMNGVSRRQISKELGINANTVKKACEEFGQSNKEKASSQNEYTTIEGEFPLTVCPSCNSNKVNTVDDNTTYCKNCGSEHIHHKTYALKINWEYIE